MGIESHKTASTDSGDFKKCDSHFVGHASDVQDLNALGYQPELRRNRSMLTLLFQSLAIAAASLFVSQSYSLLVTNSTRFRSGSAQPS